MIVEIEYESWNSTGANTQDFPSALIISVPEAVDQERMDRVLTTISDRRVQIVACVGRESRKAEDVVDDYLVLNRISGVVTTAHENEDIGEIFQFIDMMMKTDNHEYKIVLTCDRSDPLLKQAVEDERLNVVGL